MKLKVSKSLLTKSLEYMIAANYAIDKEKESNILLFSDNYSLTLISGNDENRLKISMEAEVDEPGEIIISTTTLDKQVKSFAGSMIEITGNSAFVYFETTKDVAANLRCNVKIEAIETDSLADFEDVTSTKICSVNAGAVASAISAAVVAIDPKSVKEELRNVGLIVNEKGLTFVGFSSRKLAKSLIPIDTKVKKEGRLVIPLAAAKNVAKMLKKGKTDVEIAAEKNSSGNYITIKNDTCSIYLRVVSSEFPKFEQLFASKPNHSMNVNTAVFKKAIGGFAGINKDSILNLNCTTDKIELRMVVDGAETALAVGTTATGDKKFAVQAKTLKEMVSAIETTNCDIHIVNDMIMLIVSDDENVAFVNPLVK